MILSRIKPAVEEESIHVSNTKRLPSLHDFIDKRDYTGALNLLEFEHNIGKDGELTKLWMGFCAFHLGDYKRALSVYDSLQQENKNNPPKDCLLYLACCYFFLGMYTHVDEVMKKVPHSRLKIRLMFHLAHKLADENKLMEYHKQLADVIEDQLSLASIHYLRAHYQEAIDIYKRILLDNREYLALNVYIAFCYYKLDYYDVSQDVLNIYLQKYSDSVIATNLKACNYFRLYNGKVAEAEIKSLQDQNSINSFSFGQDLLRHNLVVFRNGEFAMQILPPLVDIVPEARLNLVIHYLKQHDYQEAFELIKNVEPSVPHEYILKAVVNAAYGQHSKLRENIKIAQHFFQLVGSSSSECDTIPGRQCMASSYFLQKEFTEVQLYLSSIKSYYFNDDCFNFNFAQTKTALGYYKEAEEIFMLIQNERILNDFIYISHLARCFIMNRKPQSAWELYLKMETSAESFSLLQLIANDCYRMAQFWHAAKAFDMLERLDPLPEYWEGKRGACVGVLQMIIAGRQARDSLSDMVQLLRNSANAQVEPIIRVIKRWAKDNRINI
ncbi:intraflagellar transport protein 56-like [Planococcus citri]|uniref:intraflagellar transport protein 56-like n=1 Tax=Planococcus citri TaxID=170843 RepID=UPI0031F8FDA6